jgi:hypothetical protein
MIYIQNVVFPGSGQEFSDWLENNFVGDKSALKVVVPCMDKPIEKWSLAVVERVKGRGRYYISAIKLIN